MSCRACGQANDWCAVYEGCPLNKGNAHDLKPATRNSEALEQFTTFCRKYPDLRFWQALAIWSQKFILSTDFTETEINRALKQSGIAAKIEVKDTWFREGK